MIQMLGQVTNLIMPKFIARKPKIKHGTYNKYGFAITLHQYCMESFLSQSVIQKSLLKLKTKDMKIRIQEVEQ